MRRFGLALATAVSLYAGTARARTPEIAIDPRDGIWIAQDDTFIFQTRDRWSVFAAGATVNKMVADQTILWVATDDGVIRFDIGSQKPTKLTMDDGLPSQRVTTVAVDDQYVWFGTNKGLVRYRKTDRTLKVYDESNGLPSNYITYAVTIGRQVWFGTRAGIAYYSPDVDGLRAFGEEDGLDSGDVEELFQLGADVWCRTDVGLSRFRIQQRVFTNFPMERMGATEIRVLTVEGENLWIGTDNGLWLFESAGDSIRIFPQQEALGSKDIVGVEVSPTYMYITTDKEILQYSKITNAIRHFTVAERLSRQEGSTGTVATGAFVTVMFPDGAVMYDPLQDQWTDRSIAVTVTGERKTTARIFGQLELEQPFLDGSHDKENSYATALGGIGFGQQFDKERSLNGSVYLDYGQLDASGIRDLQYKIEYLGNQEDFVRDVRIEDKLKYRYIEEGLDRQLLVQGAHVGLATAGAEPKAKLQVDVGFRRGQVVRDFLTGPWQEVYQLSQKYILPGSERVYVDGELLNNGTDYTIIYPTGQLTFLNRERIDDLSVITIEYERDLMPKKSLGTLSLQSRLPTSNEIGTWTLSGSPTLLSTDTALYNDMDGAAPKYIDLGWVSGVHATYQQGGSSITVYIHNMGTPEMAKAIYDRYLPVSRQDLNKVKNPNNPAEEIVNAVLDLSLVGSYAAYAYTDQYYIEVNISDGSEASKVYVKTFTLQILNRGKLVTENLGDAFKEALLAARGTYSPIHGMELGARVVQLQQLSGTPYTNSNDQQVETTPMHLTSGMVDGRYQTQVGEGGLLTSYFELGGSHDSSGVRKDGLAGMGFMRLSTPRLEGMVSGRINTQDWTPVGHTTPSAPDPVTGATQRTYNDARMGTLRDQAQFNVTGYPASWLPVTALFTRQRAWLADGSGDTGVLQHAIARVQLNKAGLPATTLQLGSTELDNPHAFQMHRLQGSAQTDYDLAPLLSFTHIKRFNVRALYSLSQAETEQDGVWTRGDRVRLIRFEGKLSPTLTETANVLFRSRDVGQQTEADGPYWRNLYHWEMLSGAQSTIIPGLVPRFSYNVFYDDCRNQAGCSGTGSGISDSTSSGSATTGGVAWANTGPQGSAAIMPGPGTVSFTGPMRAVTGVMGGGLGIYPGQWWPKLGPLALLPTVAVGDTERSEDGVKEQYDRVYDYVGTEVWAGRQLEMMLYQRYRFTTTSAEAYENAGMLSLQNRIVYRPIFTSPITLLVNYQGDRARDSAETPWAKKQVYFDRLEWLMRWNQVLTTRTRLNVWREETSNLEFKDPTTGLTQTADYTQWTYGGELQLRFYPLEDVSALYVYLMAEWRWLDKSGSGAFTGWNLLPGSGVIWRMGDKLYLYGYVTVDHLQCVSGMAGACSDHTNVTPYVYFTMNL